ncbi:MAG TPA: TA system VapC family ribonuclease toxin [Terriglobales bacterium]|jgi:toxin-antitoxin system PIN domain toxin|nr:TA system VapC family ribonuclease toxin [Terriglobales bacterium]
MVNGYLLDVNVLIALVRVDHIAHKTARRWFERLGGSHWATCAMTEGGFVRIITNPRFLDSPPDMGEALDMLRLLTRLSGHQFWTMDLSFVETVAPVQERLFGHQQVTDAYLLGLAIKKRGKLATFDRGVSVLAGRELHRYLEIIE